VSSPNEPGYPRTGDGPSSANGAAGRDGGSLANSAPRSGPLTGNVTDRGENPPWQRGRAAQTPPPARAEAPRNAPAPGGAPGPDARLNRFMSGASAPVDEAHVPTRTERTDTGRNETYASELPDLSGPVPRPPQRKAPAERSAPEPAARPNAATSRLQVGNRPQGSLRASMQIRRIDPWSALKVSLILSVVLFFVWMIAVAFLYLVLGGMGVWSKLNSNVGDLLTSASGSGGELVSSGTIFGGAALIGLVNIVLLTAMATLGAFIYNLITDLVGGVEVTLGDRD
jgi:hypothetical protein